jgi:hypothetical protein
MMRRYTAASAIVLALGFTLTSAAARQAPDAGALKAIAGKEKKPHEQTVTFVSPPLTPAESKAFSGKLQAIRQLLLAAPALQNLRGADWATFARIDGHLPGRPLKATLGYIAYPYFFNARLNRAESSAEGSPFTISINDADIVLGNHGYRVDQEAQFTFAPETTGELDGYPVYSAEDRFVVITPDARPIYVAVTEQRYLELRIAQERKSLEHFKKSLSQMPDSPAKSAAIDKQTAHLSALEAELAELPDAQRTSPALDPDGAPTKRPSMLAEIGARKTRAIVMPNPDLFDPGKPRASVQLIVLGSIRYRPDLFREVQPQIDKHALAALLD